MSISLEWIKNLRTDKERKDFEEVLRNNTMVADRLLEILVAWEEDLNKRDTRETDFDTPNWEVKQAYRIGEKALIRKVKDLFAFRLDRTRNV